MLLSVLWMVGCSGPAAPDVEVCRDFIHRLCIQPQCPAVLPLYGSAPRCEDALLAQSGCSDDAFVFTSPTREHFLTCRAPLLNNGTNREQAPACADVNDSFQQCPEVVRLLKGTH